MVEIQRLASRVIETVLAGHNLDQALAALFSRQRGLAPAQRAAIQDISYGAIRHFGQLQAVLDRLAKRPVADATLRALMLAALYQLQHTKAKPYAVVDHAVQTAERIGAAGAKGFVNAVLRAFLRRREAVLTEALCNEPAVFSYPAWWIDKLKQQYPEAWQAILQAGNRHPPMNLRVNRRRSSGAQYMEMLLHEGMAASELAGGALCLERPVPVDQLPGFAQGLVSVQDDAAQYAAPLLDARDGMRVLDACAAPGGKTGHLLELADLDLLALDLDSKRLARVAENLDRLGLRATLKCADSLEVQDWWDGNPFDRILLDVPCSGSGVVKRRPDIKWLRRPADIAQFAAQQRNLLMQLWQALASGGKLLYASCSLFAEENRETVAHFLACHPDAREIRLHPPLSSGQIIPDAFHDGFFYALLHKS